MRASAPPRGCCRAGAACLRLSVPGRPSVRSLGSTSSPWGTSSGRKGRRSSGSPAAVTSGFRSRMQKRRAWRVAATPHSSTLLAISPTAGQTLPSLTLRPPSRRLHTTLLGAARLLRTRFTAAAPGQQSHPL